MTTSRAPASAEERRARPGAPGSPLRHDVALEVPRRAAHSHEQAGGRVFLGGRSGRGKRSTRPWGFLCTRGRAPNSTTSTCTYRSTATLLAMGADPFDTLRQMKNVATDPYSALGETSATTIRCVAGTSCPCRRRSEVQFSMAPGTALANKRAAEQGFVFMESPSSKAGMPAPPRAISSTMPRPGPGSPRRELPCLMIVANKPVGGISTPASEQHAEKHIADRASVFGIKSAVVDGNDAEVCYRERKRAMDYVRTERRPFLFEALVSRLYGHARRHVGGELRPGGG